MSKLTLFGLFAMLGGFLLLGFQAISTIMGTENVWKSITLLDVFGKDQASWLDGRALGSIQTAINYIVTMPLFLLMFCVAGLLFIINAILGE
jgi:hypothetical protein